MSVSLGTRVDYRGHRWIVFAEASNLDGDRKVVLRRNGEAQTNWSSEIAYSRDFTNPVLPSFTVGQSVKVGFSPWRLNGTVKEVISGDRTLYRVELEADELESPQGTKYLREAVDVVIGPEVMDV